MPVVPSPEYNVILERGRMGTNGCLKLSPKGNQGFIIRFGSELHVIKESFLYISPTMKSSHILDFDLILPINEDGLANVFAAAL